MSDKIREIKRLLDVVKITDWSEIDDLVNKIESILNDIEQPKRKPLPDGRLPMTDEEKEEFINLILWHRYYDLESVAVVDDLLTIGRSNNGIHCDYIFSHSVKAILWLADRFNLEGNNDIERRCDMIDFNKINKMMVDFPITKMTISDCFGCEMKLICHSWDFMSIKTDTIEQAFEELSKFSYDEIKKSIEDYKVIVVRKRT